jgi:hypothetical protein
MLKKVSLIACVLFIGNLVTLFLYSCRCKTDKRNYCTDLQSISISMQDNGGLDPQPVLNHRVYAKALILSVSAHEVQYECRRNTSTLFSAAYAMCWENNKNNKNRYAITQTHIFLNRDYDKDHPAGTDIKDLFIQKGDDYYLMAAPDDTTGTYTFNVQVAYEQFLKPKNDTLLAMTAPLKLKK